METHCSRAGVRNPPLERNPLVVGSIPVGVGSQENPTDVCHVVHTHGRTFKDVTVEERREREREEGERVRGEKCKRD